MREIRSDQLFELSDELMDALGRQVEPEDLDGDDAILVRVDRAEDGTEDTGANLMKNTERSEGVRWRRAGSVRVQCGYSSGRRVDRSIEPPRLQSVRPENSWLHLAPRTPSLRQ
jgi:hypothetical protein